MDTISIQRWLDLDARVQHVPDVDHIFFDSSATRHFASDEVRAAFRERWLGRYLEHDADQFFVATQGEGKVVGYLAGCADHPLKASRFSDIGYFRTFADLLDQYPAHLHVNVASTCRGQGIGARLIDCFAMSAHTAGACGMHVVTGRQSRNVGFYTRKGFERLGECVSNNVSNVFLGRRLDFLSENGAEPA